MGYERSLIILFTGTDILEIPWENGPGGRKRSKGDRVIELRIAVPLSSSSIELLGMFFGVLSFKLTRRIRGGTATSSPLLSCTFCRSVAEGLAFLSALVDWAAAFLPFCAVLRSFLRWLAMIGGDNTIPSRSNSDVVFR